MTWLKIVELVLGVASQLLDWRAKKERDRLVVNTKLLELADETNQLLQKARRISGQSIDFGDDWLQPHKRKNK